MRLEGWNEIPDGYGARFDITHAPLWLRLWFRTPALDKFAYPVVVRRGFGHLTADPGRVPEQLGDVGPGWHIDPDGQVGASVVTPYRSSRCPAPAAPTLRASGVAPAGRAEATDQNSPSRRLAR